MTRMDSLGLKVELEPRNCRTATWATRLRFVSTRRAGVLDDDPYPLSKTRPQPPATGGISTRQRRRRRNGGPGKALQIGHL
jgi:hypothetical protein